MNAARILIAEDDEVQREILEDILDEAGYEVDTYGSPRDALASLEQST